jgi:hypothetical protein
MKDIFDLFWKYREKFDENFPAFEFMGVPDEKVIGIIERCIKNDTPYKTEYDEEKVY